jgi:uncharacterized protein YyaL (SSP411 family)
LGACYGDDLAVGPAIEIAIIGDPVHEDVKALFDVINSGYLPNKVVALGKPPQIAEKASIELLNHRTQIDGKATAYVCRNFVCEAPLTEPAQLRSLLFS